MINDSNNKKSKIKELKRKRIFIKEIKDDSFRKTKRQKNLKNTGFFIFKKKINFT